MSIAGNFRSVFKSMVAVLVLTQLLLGCVGISVGTDEERVAKRALQNQDALAKNDYKKSYMFLTPEYRASRTYKMYLGTRGAAVKRESSSIHSVGCEENVCTVLINLYYRYQGLMGMHIDDSQPSQHRVNEEKWVKVDNQWWLYLEK